jgi:hypothetical protein
MSAATRVLSVPGCGGESARASGVPDDSVYVVGNTFSDGKTYYRVTASDVPENSSFTLSINTQDIFSCHPRNFDGILTVSSLFSLSLIVFNR